MAPTSLIPTVTSSSSIPALPFSSTKLINSDTNVVTSATSTEVTVPVTRREIVLSLTTLTASLAAAVPKAKATNDEEYVKETTDVINKVRSTIGLDKSDPNVAAAVADLREASNSWVAKYRREKSLLARASFRDIYSALNAVSGHYISFGPTAPIPGKRRARILEEVDTAEKALKRGR